MNCLPKTHRTGVSVGTFKDAQRALAHFARQGSACDPHNELHQLVYLQLRSHYGRIKGQTLERYLKSAQSNVVCESSSHRNLWAVPKSNFAAGLPEDIEDAMVPEEYFSDMEALGFDTQFFRHYYYVVDKVIPQCRLGNGAVTIQFSTGPGWNATCSSEALNRMAGALPQAAPPLGALLPCVCAERVRHPAHPRRIQPRKSVDYSTKR